jgi:transmembrane sensor
MIDDLDPFLLDRYLAGEATSDDAQAIAQWVTGAPNRGVLLAALRAESAPRDTSAIRDMAHRRIVERIDTHGERYMRWRHTPALFRTSSHVIPRRTLMVACGAVAAGAFVFAGIYTGRVRTTTSQSSYTTRGGEQDTVTLSGGGRIVLGPATTVVVSVRGSGDTRRTIADVVGQAQFVIAHRPQAPFVVQTRSATVQVLGTTFVVRHYQGDSVAQVSVTEGRVSLVGRKIPRTRPTDSGFVRVSPNGATDAWMSGTLVFRKTPIRQIVAELSRVYDADIRVSDSVLAARTYSWSVPVTQQSLAGVLEAITAALDAHVKRTGNVITIVPGAETKRRSNGMPLSTIQEKQYGR